MKRTTHACTTSAFTAAEKQEFVTAHNGHRAYVVTNMQASNMNRVVRLLCILPVRMAIISGHMCVCDCT